MTKVWRVVPLMESDTFMEILWQISLEVVWGFHGENMVNQITRQSPYQF